MPCLKEGFRMRALAPQWSTGVISDGLWGRAVVAPPMEAGVQRPATWAVREWVPTKTWTRLEWASPAGNTPCASSSWHQQTGRSHCGMLTTKIRITVHLFFFDKILFTIKRSSNNIVLIQKILRITFNAEPQYQTTADPLTIYPQTTSNLCMWSPKWRPLNETTRPPKWPYNPSAWRTIWNLKGECL